MSRTRTRVAEQQLDLVALIAYAEPGSQLDLVEEAGVERIGPSTLVAARFDPSAERLAALACTRAVCINAAHRH